MHALQNCATSDMHLSYHLWQETTGHKKPKHLLAMLHLMELAEWFRPGDSVSKNLRVKPCVTSICEYPRNNIIRYIKKQKTKYKSS